MAIEVVTSADMHEANNPAQGKVAEAAAKDEKSASTPEEQDETNEASEASDVEGNEEESSAQADDSSEDEDQSKSEDIKPKKKGGFKKRIDKLNSRLSEKERETDFYKSESEFYKNEFMKLTSQKDSQAPKKEAQPESADGRPKEESFDTHAEYIEALTDWKIEQREKSSEAKKQLEKVKSEQQKQLEAHNLRLKSFVEKHEDFHDVLEEVDDIPMSLAVQQSILESENGPELMYELAKNRDVYKKICELSPLAAARELGKFETQFLKSSETEEKPKIKTKAPPPIAPVGTRSGSVKKNIFDPNLSQREYEALRAEQMKARA